MEVIRGFFQTIAVILRIGAFLAFAGIGLLQLFAIADWIDFYFGWDNSILAFILAGMTAWIPILGSVLGVLGAVTVWGWTLLSSILLMFSGIILFIFYFILALIFDLD